MTKKLRRNRPWTREDYGLLRDLWFSSPYPWPHTGDGQNYIIRDAQTITWLAGELHRTENGVVRVMEYILIVYDQDKKREPITKKLIGLRRSRLKPNRPLDDRVRHFYAYSQGDRYIKPGTRMTNYGSFNPKDAMPDDLAQVVFVLSDANLQRLKKWYRNNRRDVHGLYYGV